jgi:hypothetical protein
VDEERRAFADLGLKRQAATVFIYDHTVSNSKNVTPRECLGRLLETRPCADTRSDEYTVISDRYSLLQRGRRVVSTAIRCSALACVSEWPTAAGSPVAEPAM